MKATEAAGLLTIAAAFDNRKPDADAAKAWAMALEGLRFEDCRAVIVSHYQASREWLMPSDVRSGVKRLRAKRIADYGPLEPPGDLNPDDTGAYKRWLDGTTRAIADGDLTPPPAIEYDRRDVIAELGHAGRSIPDA